MSEENVLSNKIETKKVWELLTIVIVTAIIWNLPTSSLESPDDTFVIIITLNLCLGPCTEVYEDGYRK